MFCLNYSKFFCSPYRNSPYRETRCKNYLSKIAHHSFTYQQFVVCILTNSKTEIGKITKL